MTPPAPQLPTLPNAPTPPPVFASSPTGQKPQQKSMNTTFIGGAMVPNQSQTPGKTLLGQ
jgi:hypothetical protein